MKNLELSLSQKIPHVEDLVEAIKKDFVIIDDTKYKYENLRFVTIDMTNIVIVFGDTNLVIRNAIEIEKVITIHKCMLYSATVIY